MVGYEIEGEGEDARKKGDGERVMFLLVGGLVETGEMMGGIGME